MPRPSFALKVDGVWLRSVAAHGDLTYSHSWPGGCKEASFQITTRYGAHPRIVRRGALVQIVRGVHQWSGYLQEPDWNGSEASLTAAGLVRLGERFAPFDGSGNMTAELDTAIAAAQSRGTGLPWTLGAGIPTAALPFENAPRTSVTALADAHAEFLGQRWMVDAFGVVSMGIDPVAAFGGPDYYVRGGSADLGIAEDNYASRIGLRHLTTTATYRTAVYPPALTVTEYERTYGPSEFTADITDRGQIADADADALAQAVYLRSLARPGWTTALDLAPGELLNSGGKPVALEGVTARRLVRVLGVRDEVALTPYTDFVIGETQYRANDGLLTVSPVGLASRDQESVLTEALEGGGYTVVDPDA